MTTKQPVSCWSTEQKHIKECGWVNENEKAIFLHHSIHAKAIALCKAIPRLEWLGYLLGEEYAEEPGHYLVNGMVIPPQEISAAQVDVLNSELDKIPNLIGTIHSHNNMGLFFSSTDDNFIGSNYPVMIVTNNTGGYKGALRTTLPCGSLYLEEAVVTLVPPEPPKLDRFLANALTKVKEKIWAPVHAPAGSYYDPYYGGFFESDIPAPASRLTTAPVIERVKCIGCGGFIPDGHGFIVTGGGYYHLACSPHRADKPSDPASANLIADSAPTGQP